MANNRICGTCHSDNVKEETLKKAMVTAWNSIVENRDDYLPVWQKKITQGNALDRLRAEQMLAITAEGRIEEEIPELTRVVLKDITIEGPETFRFAVEFCRTYFLDFGLFI